MFNRGSNVLPSSGLCSPILDAILAHVEVMLGHFGVYVAPFWELCWPIFADEVTKKTM